MSAVNCGPKWPCAAWRQFRLRSLAAFRTDDTLALIFSDMRCDGRQFGHLMPPRLALRGHPARQAAVAMAARRRKHLDHPIDAAQRRQSAPVATMTRLAARLAPALLPSLPLGRCSPANPSEDGGFDEVVEFCSRNASLRSSCSSRTPDSALCVVVSRKLCVVAVPFRRVATV